MDLYAIQQIFGLVFPVVGPLAGMIYTYVATQRANARKEIDGLTKRLEVAELTLLSAGHTATTLVTVGTELADHEKRLSRVENDMQHLPGKSDVHDLQLIIVKLEGTVGRLEEKVTGIGRTVGNLDSYMRSEGKGES